MNLLRMFARTPSPARFEESRVGYAVGDIHGRADLLAEMLALLEASAEADMRKGRPPVVIFLGDYVDRGRESRAVIDMLLEQRPKGFERRYLRGNHEQAMCAFMDAPLENRAWVLQGGAETLEAYGVTPPAPLQATNDDWIAAAEALNGAVPGAHRAFLDGLERYLVFGDYAFVHAGVDAGRALEDQTDQDLYWIRERFLANKRGFSHVVVHGHTPVEHPFADQRRVAVDTGAYASGVLTAARFEADQLSFVSVTGRSAAKSREDGGPPKF